jgi:hypothetical protein
VVLDRLASREVGLVVAAVGLVEKRMRIRLRTIFTLFRQGQPETPTLRVPTEHPATQVILEMMA